MTEQMHKTKKKQKSEDRQSPKAKKKKEQKSRQVAAVDAARAVERDQQAKASAETAEPVAQAEQSSDLDAMSDDKKIKVCAAYRIKYRVKGADGNDAPKRNIAPHLVAWHKQNRRGMLPNADRLQQIILSYCGNWDPEEADSQCIAVEVGPKDTDIVEYNRAFREGRPEFAAAAGAPEVAAASHSHLNLSMHGVRAGATASLPGIR